ncbi:hypothetical protein VTG60DRAFT_6214 [Thermothelomyces hinnuleus]
MSAQSSPGPGRNDRIAPLHRCSDDETATKWFCGNEKSAPDDKDCASVDGDVELPDGIYVYATAGDTLDNKATASPIPPPGTSRATGVPAVTATASGPTQHSSVAHPVETSTRSFPGTYVSSASISTDTSPTATPGSNAPESSASEPASSWPATTAPGVPPPVPSDASEDEDDGFGSVIPIGVGVAVGTSILIAGSVIVFFYQRKRRRRAPVRAETPPPFEFSLIDRQAPGWLMPSPDARLREPHGAGNMHGNVKGAPAAATAARYELPRESVGGI